MKKRNMLIVAVLFSAVINVVAQDTIVPVNGGNKNVGKNTGLSNESYMDKYFSVGFGGGTAYGGCGVKVQLKTDNKLGLAYHFGIGTTFENDINVNVGIKYYFYKWAYLNPQLGYFLIKNEGIDINHNYYSEHEADVYGAFLLGGDLFLNKHFGLDIGLGAVVFDDYIGPTAGIGLQYKF